ncbi:MAG: acyl carrier protein [Opitutaceae bacterium]|nr:acyl carrier protein [Opitutaceae bacterium]
MNTFATRDQVRDAVLALLRDFLGTEAPSAITEATDPIKDLGLDSEDGVDFACLLSERFACTVPEDVNPLVNDAKHCGRRIGEIIDFMFALLNKA